jgi:hypothetical protein
MNHFMARLIFCFFAEDTDIFNGTGLFTSTIEQMSARDSSNTHGVIAGLFRAMNTKIEDRAAANLPRWANVLPYVNGGLFSGSLDVPRFSDVFAVKQRWIIADLNRPYTYGEFARLPPWRRAHCALRN